MISNINSSSPQEGKNFKITLGKNARRDLTIGQASPNAVAIDLEEISHENTPVRTNINSQTTEVSIDKIFQTLFSKKSGKTTPKKNPIGLSYEEIECFQGFISNFYEYIESEVKNTKTAGFWDLVNAFFRPTKSEIGIIIQNGFLRNMPLLTGLNLLLVTGLETLAIKTINKKDDQENLSTYLAIGTLSASVGIIFAGLFKQIQMQNGWFRNQTKELDKLIEKDENGNIKFKNHVILDGANRITGSYNLITIFENLKNSIQNEINDFIYINKSNNELAAYNQINHLEQIIEINSLRASQLNKKKSLFGLKQDQQSGILYNPNLSNSR